MSPVRLAMDGMGLGRTIRVPELVRADDEVDFLDPSFGEVECRDSSPG
ncbi:hypothetical protein ACFYWY_36280 [Streptomyces sp. NPDC002870]